MGHASRGGEADDRGLGIEFSLRAAFNTVHGVDFSDCWLAEPFSSTVLSSASAIRAELCGAVVQRNGRFLCAILAPTLGARDEALALASGIVGIRNSTRSDMRLDLGSCGVRSFRDTDAADLTRHANNRRIWLQLRDRFPHPYELDDARTFIAAARRADPETEFAITVGDLAVGAIGVTLGKDVERCSAEVGYWIGEPYWGRGIASRVLAEFTPFALGAYDLERLYAVPFASNAASCRVLEKAGYRLEGRMLRSAIKDGTVHDQYLYATLSGNRT